MNMDKFKENVKKYLLSVREYPIRYVGDESML